jgi:hypothetical protein
MPVRQDPISGTLAPRLKAAFMRTLPTPRWQPYLIAAGHDENRAIRLYLWNAAIGQSFHFPLQAVEVALRNVVDAALRTQFGADWWKTAPCRNHIGLKRCEEIDKAETRLINKYGVAAPTTDQIVASLTFGFWAALTHAKVTRLWPARRAAVFPSLPAALSVSDVSLVTNNVQALRNRIFHHEPLIGRNLSGDYGEILKLLGWICTETEKWVRANSCVPVIIRARP